MREGALQLGTALLGIHSIPFHSTIPVQSIPPFHSIVPVHRIQTPSTTGVSPAKLLIGNPKSRLDLLKSDISYRVEAKQQQQKLTHNSHAHALQFSEGEEVYVRNFQQSGQSWIPGVISKATGPVSYQVELDNGQIIRRHQDHVQREWLY